MHTARADYRGSAYRFAKYGPDFGLYLVPPSAERYGKDALATIGKTGYIREATSGKALTKNVSR